MADDEVDVEAVAALRKKRQFRKFTFRGLELDRLLDLSHEELLGFVTARARRRMQRGLKRKPMALIKKLRKAKAGETKIRLSSSYGRHNVNNRVYIFNSINILHRTFSHWSS